MGYGTVEAQPAPTQTEIALSQEILDRAVPTIGSVVCFAILTGALRVFGASSGVALSIVVPLFIVTLIVALNARQQPTHDTKARAQQPVTNHRRQRAAG